MIKGQVICYNIFKFVYISISLRQYNREGMKRGGPIKLLLAEDEKRMAEALGEILALEGYDVNLAADGEEALAAARRGVYEILVLDVMMPKINGFELTARLRAEGNRLPADPAYSVRGLISI